MEDLLITPDELTRLHNTTIEWYAEKQNLNFTDRKMMEALNECLVRGIGVHAIRDMLTELYKTKI